MTMSEQINNAIIAHCEWVEKLRVAIESGQIDISVETAIQDNVCPFGQWLYGDTIPETAKALPGYQSVLRLHARFHEFAATILSIAISGNRDDAFNRIIKSSDYAITSHMLTLSLKLWLIDVHKFNITAQKD